MAIEDTAPALGDAIRSAIQLDAPLKERLDIIANAVERFRPQQAAAIGRLIGRLQGSRAGAGAPCVGETMPGFVLPDEDGTVVRLGELLRKGPVVVAFQRGHWCPYCRLNSVGIARAHEQVAALGGQIVAIVPEQAEFSRVMKAAAKASFPFLTDSANGYALSLNLAIWVGLEMEEIMAEAGIELPRYQGNSAWMLPIPASFVLDRRGKVAARFVDPDHRRRMEIDDMLEAVRLVS